MDTENFTVIYSTLLESVGLYFSIEILYSYLFTSVTLTGIITNIINIYILNQKEFTASLFKYLRIYCVNSLIVCLSGSFVFASFVRNFNSTPVIYDALFYYVYIFIPFANTGYFYGSVLDIMIVLERISLFVKFFKTFATRINFCCFIGLIVCIILNVPYFFVYVPKTNEFNISSTSSVYITYYDVSNIAKTRIVQILTYIEFVLRDFLLLVFEILSNLISVIFLKKHLEKKTILSNSHIALTNDNSFNSESIITSGLPQEGKKRKVNSNSEITSAEKNMTILVILMSSLSVFEHTMILSCVIYSYYFVDYTAFLLGFLGDFSIILKHSSNFFLFFLLNKKFHKVFSKQFNLRKI